MKILNGCAPPDSFSQCQHRFRMTGPWLLLGNLAAALLLSGCSSSATVAAKPAAPSVTLFTAKDEQLVDYDEFVGRTEAIETVEVRARVSGFIRSVEFKEGTVVKEGDLLFTIEPEAYDAIQAQSVAKIELWRAKQNLAESKLVRAKSLRVTGAITEDEYEEYDAAVKEAAAAIVAAEADAKRTALDVEYTKVLAPISGQIDKAFVTRGNVVSGGLGTGTSLTRIVKSDPIFAYVDVDENTILKYIRKLSGDQATAGRTVDQFNVPCYLQLGDESDFPHVGKLDFVENRVDAETGTIRMRGIFPNADRLLTGGLFVRVRIPITQPYAAVLIPEEAIGNDQSQRFAYVVDGNIAKRRNLTVGRQEGKLRVVKDGIRAGEKVIATGIQRVRPDKEVTIPQE